MKTTVEIENRLVDAAKRLAAERGLTLDRVIEESLRTMLAVPSGQSQVKFEWKTRKGVRPPNVDIDNRNELYDMMENRD